MDIVHDYPPNYDQIEAAFGPLPRGAIFCYGNTIYVPSGEELTPDLIVHERTHQEQQDNDPDGWWESYLTDPRFRLEQEIEAYRNQYRFARQTFKDPNLLTRFLMGITKALSGPMYGNIVTHRQALGLVTGKARIITNDEGYHVVSS